jgi:hypothetical protein
MPVPASIDELSPTASANYPLGTEQVFPNLDNYLRFHAACLAQLRDRISAEGLPLASVMWWGGARASIQSRFAPMDGQFLSRAAYPALWAMVSAGGYPLVTESAWAGDAGARASFSSGDGATTFRMPDLNGKQGGFGATTVRGDGSYSAGAAGRMQDGQNLSHAHGASASQEGAHGHSVSGSTSTDGFHNHGVPDGNSAQGESSTSFDGGWNAPFAYVQTTGAGSHSHSISGTAFAAGSHTHSIGIAADGGNETRMKSATGAWVMRVQ